MRKKRGILFSVVLILAFFAFGVLPVGAYSMSVSGWAVNVDSVLYESIDGDSIGQIPNLTAGPGTLTWTTNVAGSHEFIRFIDQEISESANGSGNEYGATGGTPVCGQFWELGDPGAVLASGSVTNYLGVIYSHVLSGVLNNTNSVPYSSEYDVSMALGWNFTLGTGERAEITMSFTDEPVNCFYLLHKDLIDNDANIYFYSTLDIIEEGPVIPEPSTIFLMGIGLVGLLGVQRRRISRKKV